MCVYERSLITVIGLLLFAVVPSSGQTTTYNPPPLTVPLIPTSHSDLPALPGIRISWYSDAAQGQVMMHLENVSSKDINAYDISIKVKYADGSTNPFCRNGYSCFPGERLTSFPVVAANGMEPESFAAGTSRDEPLEPVRDNKEVTDVEAVPDVIIYMDDTTQVQNERAFKQIMASRKGALLALQQVSETIKRVLADGSANPVDAAKEELTRIEIALRMKHLPPEEPENNEEQSLRGEMRQLDNAKQVSKGMKMNERDYLAKLAEDFDKQIALMEPHCEVKRIE